MKTRIHVNQHNIKRNAKSGVGSLPVITIKDYKNNRKANDCRIVDENGKVVARVIYSPEKPLSCGAKVWIETELDVET